MLDLSKRYGIAITSFYLFFSILSLAFSALEYQDELDSFPCECGEEWLYEDENVLESMMDLSRKKCVPCIAGGKPLKGEELQNFFRQLDGTWKLVEEHHLEKEYHFKNFKEALVFVNRIGQLAEAEGHHPDISLSWGEVKLLYWTHKINGLSESDFIMAAKSDLCLL